MNKKKIKDRMRETFESEVPDVLSKIKASPDFYIPEKHQTVFGLRRFFNKKMALSLMSVFVIALIVVSMINRNNDPVVASTLTLDVNPSIEITLDEDDFVIAVSAINDDGDEVVQKNIKYLGMTLDEVLEVLVDRLNELGYIVTTVDDSNIILIEVSSDNEVRRQRVEELLKAKLQTEMNKHSNSNWVLNSRDIQLTEEQRTRINQDSRLGTYTRAKLTLMYRINSLDSSNTLRELEQLNIRQLYNIFIELEDPDNLPDYNQMPGRRQPNNYNPIDLGNELNA